MADDIKIKGLEIEGENLSWNERICIGYSVTEQVINKLCLDIRDYMSWAIVSEEEKRNFQSYNRLTFKRENFKKVDEKILATNAFVLLTSSYFRFAKIQCALFKGNNRDEFIDKKEYVGLLYEQIEGAYQFVLCHINRSTEIEGLVRKDRYELPLGAIREMIINAQCHRNFINNACVQVALCDDRLEVTSPEMLYEGLTLEEVMSGRSKIRNRAVAEIFSRMELIEEWGIGIRRILKRTKEYGLANPKFCEIGDTFRVNLYGSVDKEPINWNREEEIIDYVQKHGSISNKEAREILGLTHSTTKRL